MTRTAFQPCDGSSLPDGLSSSTHWQTAITGIGGDGMTRISEMSSRRRLLSASAARSSAGCASCSAFSACSASYLMRSLSSFRCWRVSLASFSFFEASAWRSDSAAKYAWHSLDLRSTSILRLASSSPYDSTVSAASTRRFRPLSRRVNCASFLARLTASSLRYVCR